MRALPITDWAWPLTFHADAARPMPFECWLLWHHAVLIPPAVEC